MNSAKILVSVLVDSAIPWCEGECTTDWLKAEHQALARQEIARRHSERVEVEFVDIRAPSASPRQASLISRVQREKLPFPVLLMNGHPRITGPFDMRMLLDIIEVETESTI